jgi:nucleotide-binding universal stress UspA family protein
LFRKVFEEKAVTQRGDTMKVLLPVDGSEASQLTLKWAVQFLDKETTQVFLFHVIYYTPDAMVHPAEIEEAEKILSRAEIFLKNYGFSVEETTYDLGTPVEAICRYADEKKVDQIIMGSHGRQGLANAFIGSISRGVFQQAKQPVLLFNNTSKPSLEVSHIERLERQSR